LEVSDETISAHLRAKKSGKRFKEASGHRTVQGLGRSRDEGRVRYLVAARPRRGKSTFAAGLISQASESGRPQSYLFTVLERERESEQRIGIYLGSDHTTSNACHIDRSDDISADYILGVIKGKIAPGSLIVVDYLQLMDEKRVNPAIQEQIEQLKSFAREHRCIFIFLGQVSP
jgi:hypothetical protein